jgi:hypothetical protein
MKRRRRVTFEESLRECRDADTANPGGLNLVQEVVGVFLLAVWYSIVGVPEDAPLEHWGLHVTGVCPGCGECHKLFVPGHRYRIETQVQPIGSGRFQVVAVFHRRGIFGSSIVGRVDVHECPKESEG